MRQRCAFGILAKILVFLNFVFRILHAVDRRGRIFRGAVKLTELRFCLLGVRIAAIIGRSAVVKRQLRCPVRRCADHAARRCQVNAVRQSIAQRRRIQPIAQRGWVKPAAKITQTAAQITKSARQPADHTRQNRRGQITQQVLAEVAQQRTCHPRPAARPAAMVIARFEQIGIIIF